MQRNNTYDIAKCWAIVSVIVYRFKKGFTIFKPLLYNNVSLLHIYCKGHIFQF